MIHGKDEPGRQCDPPPLVQPFGGQYVIFGIPPGLPTYGAVRGEDLADLQRQVDGAGDAAFLRSLGIEP